jgi:hypothetical protein
MTEVQILFQLEKAYGKTMTLTQALEAMGQITFAMEVLDEEGNKLYDIQDLILEIGNAVMEEDYEMEVW